MSPCGHWWFYARVGEVPGFSARPPRRTNGSRLSAPCPFVPSSLCREEIEKRANLLSQLRLVSHLGLAIDAITVSPADPLTHDVAGLD